MAGVGLDHARGQRLGLRELAARQRLLRLHQQARQDLAASGQRQGVVGLSLQHLQVQRQGAARHLLQPALGLRRAGVLQQGGHVGARGFDALEVAFKPQQRGGRRRHAARHFDARAGGGGVAPADRVARLGQRRVAHRGHAGARGQVVGIAGQHGLEALAGAAAVGAAQVAAGQRLLRQFDLHVDGRVRHQPLADLLAPLAQQQAQPGQHHERHQQQHPRPGAALRGPARRRRAMPGTRQVELVQGPQLGRAAGPGASLRHAAVSFMAARIPAPPERGPVEFS